MVEHCANKYLKRGGGGKPGAGKHLGGRCCVKAADVVAKLLKPGKDSAHKRAAVADIPGVDLKVVKLNGINVVASGFYSDNAVIVF